MLSLSPDVNYIGEPFNIGTKRYWSPLQYWFEYVAADDDPERQKIFLAYLRRFTHFTVKGAISDIAHIRSEGEAKEIIKRYISFFAHKRQLFKDPIAIMSVDWLTAHFDLDVVLCIRHPAAFVASLKVKNWNFDFAWFGQQKKLINGVLKPFKEQIEAMSVNKHDIVDQAILLWNMIYYRVWLYQEAHPDWLLIRHEDISRNPSEEFRKLFDKLNLAFSPKIEKKILETTTHTTHEDALVRNSAENTMSWKKRLTAEEINKVRENTKEIGSHYYSEKEW